MVISNFQRWGQALTVRRLDAPTVRDALETGLTLALALQVARLAWALAIPTGAFGMVASAPPTVIDLSILERFDPFFRPADAGAAVEGATADAMLALYGVRVGGVGGGSAIIGASDGPQASYGIGDEVQPGVALAEVGSDHVILLRGGQRLKLDFAATTSPAAPQPAAAPSSAARAADPARLMAEAGLRPRVANGVIDGFTIGANSALARDFGLRTGDVLLAVNGTALDSPGQMAALRAQLSAASTAEIRFERNGEVRTSTVRIAAR